MSESPAVVIGADEACLQGHFPGNPLVPGVVILEHVLEEISRTQAASLSLARIPAVKFLSPLRPGEPLTIELGAPDEGNTVRFTCRVGARAVAAGLLTMRERTP